MLFQAAAFALLAPVLVAQAIDPNGTPAGSKAPVLRTDAVAIEAPAVAWVPFGPEAFSVARESQRPILLYVSAPWEYHDHVMAEVTYGDPRVQQLLRDRFVAIRVDTEERPDVFFRYGMGAWPSTAVLIPSGHPLYFPEPDGHTIKRAGGTFFTPEELVAYLSQLADYYAANRAQVEALSEATDARVLQQQNAERGELAPQALEVVVGALLDRYGTRPEQATPGEHHPYFALAKLGFYYWGLKSDRRVLDMGLGHLVDLSRGGIHDRVGGGFFRYAQDALFRHTAFEKLPATNADALDAYVEAWQVTRHPAYLAIARGVIEHEQRHGWSPASHSFVGPMAAFSPGGGNGDYYTWTAEELEKILTPEELPVAVAAFEIGAVGEMTQTAPRRNIVFMQEGPTLYSQRTGMPHERAEDLLASAVAKMKAARESRSLPSVDRRSFSDSSGRLISAFVRAAGALGEKELARTALESLEILMARCRLQEGLMAHVCQPDRMQLAPRSFLSDQARVIGALVDAYEYTGDGRRLVEAQGLAVRAAELFKDVTTGGFSDTIADPEAPGLMAWPYRDMSENMAMAEALLRLGLLVDDELLRKAGRRAVESWMDEYGGMARHAAAFALASQRFINPPLEILVAGGVGPDGADSGAIAPALRLYHPWRIVRHYGLEEGAVEIRRRGKAPIEGPWIAFCIAGDCDGPFPPDGKLAEKLEAFIKPGSEKAAAN